MEGPSLKPQGDYVVATRSGNLIFTAGMTPRKNGLLIQTGPVKSDEPLENYRDAVILACANALAAAQTMLTPDEHFAAILSMTVFIASEPDFSAHSKLADFASSYLRSKLGAKGIASRAAVGVLNLPGNAPVEIQLIASV